MPTTEERLAALEKQMAAWMDQRPTNYYTHQYSGEEIDNAVSRALPDGAIDQSVGTFVRPNLLDNWYFGNPVNQRGQTEYTGEWIYTIDRWELSDGGGTLTVEDGSIIYTSASYLFQPLDNDISKQLAGKTLTISFLYADGTLDIGTSKIAPSWSSWTVFIETANVRLVGTENGRLWVLNTGAGKAIVAAKLEIGPTQTLVHQDAAGNWVLNAVPEYGEQLRRCQRYHYQVHYSQYEIIGFAYDGPEYTFIIIPLPTEMRGATPTLKIIGDINIGGKVRTLTECRCHGCEAIIGVSYTEQPSSVGATYAYSPSSGGVTISIIYDL